MSRYELNSARPADKYHELRPGQMVSTGPRKWLIGTIETEILYPL